MQAVNLDVLILDFEGKEIPSERPKEGDKDDNEIVKPKWLTLKKVCVDSLMNETQQTVAEKAEEKLDRFRLGLKAGEGGEIQLTPEDQVLLKKCITRSCGALVVGRAFALIDPESNGSPEKPEA